MSLKIEDTEDVNLLAQEIHSGSISHIDQPIKTCVVPIESKKKKKKSVEEESDDLDHAEVIQYIDEELAAIAIPEDDSSVCGLSQSTFKFVIGFVIVILIAVSWTGATQFGKSTYSSHFKAPYFTTWFTTCFMIAIYPVFMLPLMCKKSPRRLQTFLRESANIFGPRGFCLQSVIVYLVQYIIPFCIIWLLTNYLYFRSLSKLLPGTVTAVFSSSSCFVYILSLIFLKDKLYLLRLTSVFLSIGGIVLMGYSEGFGSSNAMGILFVVLAALGSASYQVMFKRVMGTPTGAQVALFLTLLGFINFFLFWPLVLVMDYFKYEKLEWNDMPWKFLVGTGLLGVVFNYLVNFGISITFPLFISIGALLGVPLSAAIDAVYRGKGFGLFKIIAVFIIFGGFLLMLIPSGKLDRYEKKFKCGENREKPPVDDKYNSVDTVETS